LQKFLIPKTSGTALTSIPIHCCVNKTYRSQRIRASMNESSQHTVRLSSNAIKYLGSVRCVLALRPPIFFPPLGEISLRALMFTQRRRENPKDAEIIWPHGTHLAE
jgi:hypothetical protein